MKTECISCFINSLSKLYIYFLSVSSLGGGPALTIVDCKLFKSIAELFLPVGKIHQPPKKYLLNIGLKLVDDSSDTALGANNHQHKKVLLKFLRIKR